MFKRVLVALAVALAGLLSYAALKPGQMLIAREMVISSPVEIVL